MSYCLNPLCSAPQNDDAAEFCQCGAKLRLGDRYRAIRAIGQGGFGRTFLAVDQAASAQPLCVIKQFFPSPLKAEHLHKAAEQFRQEAQRLQELGSHAQIPALLNSLEQEGQQYLVQEFIDGHNLEQELAEHGAFSEDQVERLLLDLLPVLQFIHDRHVIHRDIKPANIIRRQTDQKLVLVDLGAAKAAIGAALAQTGTTIGSAEYTAPEQVRGKAVFASDLYSLGATCIHLLTQMSPFDLFDSSDDRWVWRDCLSQPVSDRLGRVLDKMLLSATKQRYPSANQILADLRRSRLTAPPAAVIDRDDWRLAQAHPHRKIAQDESVGTLTHAGIVAAAALSTDGRTLVCSTTSRLPAETAIHVWDLQTGAAIRQLPQVVWINAIAIHPDGKMLVGGDASGTLKFWNIQTGELTGRIRAHAGQICSIALTPNGRTLATGGADGRVKLWNFETGTLMRTLEQDSRRVPSIAISSDGCRLASSGYGSTIRLWQLSTGELLETLQGSAMNGYTAIAFAPNVTFSPYVAFSPRRSGSGSAGEQVIASGASILSSGTVNVWTLDARSSRRHHTFTAHTGLVEVIAISPDGKLLATGSRDMTIKLWNLRTQELIRTFQGHLSPVYSLIFSSSGKLLISGDGDGSLKVWAVALDWADDSPNPAQWLSRAEQQDATRLKSDYPTLQLEEPSASAHLAVSFEDGGVVAPPSAASRRSPLAVSAPAPASGRVWAVLVVLLSCLSPFAFMLIANGLRSLQAPPIVPAPPTLPSARNEPGGG